MYTYHLVHQSLVCDQASINNGDLLLIAERHHRELDGGIFDDRLLSAATVHFAGYRLHSLVEQLQLLVGFRLMFLDEQSQIMETVHQFLHAVIAHCVGVR